MLTPSTSRLRLVTVLALVALLGACDFEGDSLYDPDAPRNAAPVIASVTPNGQIVLAGVDVITIQGENFSETPSDNIVVFDDGQGSTAPGEIVAASTTELQVKVPNLPNPALRMRVAVVGAPDYSNAVAYPLTPAIIRFGDLGEKEVPFGVAADADGTAYVSLSNEGSPVGVTRFSAAGGRSPYFTSAFQWPGLARVAGELLGVRRVRALFGLPEGGSQQVLSVFEPSSLALVAVTGTADGTVYTAGNGDKIIQVAPDGSVSETAFPTRIAALAAAGPTLYVVATPEDEPSGVFSLSIAADGTLGAPTLVTTLPGTGITVNGVTIAATSIAAAADGTLYVGVSRSVDPVVEISPAGAVTPLYPGVITGPTTGLAYGAGTQLYMVRGVTPVIPGGPTPPRADLFRIETRRDGFR